MANKKQIIINILDILKRYTDEDHRLSQKEIADILKNEYNMVIDRKSVKRNLSNLLEFGYPIEYSESIRMVPNPKTGELEKNYMLSDFYLEREFSDAELRLLIDSLLFSKHIPYSQCKDLIRKLEGLSNKYFESKVKHICTLPNNKTANKQLFYTIDILDEAISKEKQVKFYTTDFFMEVSEEVAEMFKEFDRMEAAYRLRTYRHKAYYSLDREDGLEHEAVFVALSPHELYERKVTMQELHSAIASLPDKQAKRIYAHFILGMSQTEIAQAENVAKSRVSESIQRGLRSLEKILKNSF